MAEDASERPSRPQRRGPRFWGRRVAQVVYYLLVVAVAGIATAQITEQVFFPDPPAETAPFASCEEGLWVLFEAIEQGRAAAIRLDPGEIDTDPEEALQRYRDAVRPAWAHRPQVGALCGSRHGGLLDALERLRYSEEHGVRHQAVELTALRRRVRSQVAESLPSDARQIPKSDVTP